METLYSRLGTSQQLKLSPSANDNLLVVSRKPVTPLPLITSSTEKHPRTKRSEGGERHRRVSTDRRDSFKTDNSLSFEMGRMRKRNGTETTTVKVIFPDNQTESSNQDPCSSRRTSVSMFRGFVSGKTVEKRDRYSISIPEAVERSVVDSAWTLKSSSHVYGVDRQLDRGQEGSHDNCSHPHVTRVDILFKPVAKEKSNEHREPISLNKPPEKRKRLVNREQTAFGSKNSLFASTSTLPIRPAKQSSIPNLDAITGSSESIRIAGDGTWDSNAYTAKNTRIEFAQTLHVPGPFFVKRKSNCWSTKQHETKRLCTRHLQHTRPVPRQLPSALTNYDHGTNHPVNPWPIVPARRFEPSRPTPSNCPKYTLMNITKLKQSRTVEPSHPHMNLAAINSVYNWNRLSFQGSLTPPVSEADSLDDLEDFETLNLKMQMDSLINRVKDLYAN